MRARTAIEALGIGRNEARPPAGQKYEWHSILHGTTILAQGTVTATDSLPGIPPDDIIPFGLNGGPPVKSTFAIAAQIFPELNLGVPSGFRQTATDVTQAMVENPNTVLATALDLDAVTTTTTSDIATDDSPVPGGGTASTAVLEGADANAAQANASASLVTATF
jgi:hypothetical protein